MWKLFIIAGRLQLEARSANQFPALSLDRAATRSLVSPFIARETFGDARYSLICTSEVLGSLAFFIAHRRSQRGA